MLASRRSRAVAVLGLLALLVVLPVPYGAGTPVPDRGVYPDNDEFLDRADRYGGEAVVLYGRVVGTDPTVVSAPVGPDRRVRVTVVGADGLAVGAPVGVYGTLLGDRRVRARSVLVQRGRGFTYAYVVSFLAGLWTLGRLLRGWRPAPDGLRPRTGNGGTDVTGETEGNSGGEGGGAGDGPSGPADRRQGGGGGA